MGRVPGRWPTGDGSPRPPGRTSDHPQDQRQDLPYPSGQKRGQSGLREGGRRSFSIPTPTGGQSVTPHLAPSRPPNWYPFSPPPTPAGDIGQEARNSAPPQAATVKDGTIEAEYRAESWQAIEISFLSDERIQIRCGPQIETRNYGELGLWPLGVVLVFELLSGFLAIECPIDRDAISVGSPVPGAGFRPENPDLAESALPQ